MRKRNYFYILILVLMIFINHVKAEEFVYDEPRLYDINIGSNNSGGGSSEFTVDSSGYIFFDSGAISLTSDTYYIGIGGATSNAIDNSIKIPTITVTNFSCYQEDNAGTDQSSYTIYDSVNAIPLELSCTTAVGEKTCTNETNLVLSEGLITIDFEELAGTTSGHGACFIQYTNSTDYTISGGGGGSIIDTNVTTACGGDAVLLGNGTCLNSSSIGGGGTPGGSDTQVQFNDGGAFGGDANFVFENGLNITSASTTSNPLIIKAQYSQTGDIIKWLHGGGSVLGRINGNGYLGIGNVNPAVQIQFADLSSSIRFGNSGYNIIDSGYQYLRVIAQGSTEVIRFHATDGTTTQLPVVVDKVTFVTNTTEYPLTIKHTLGSGNPTVNFGTGLSLDLEPSHAPTSTEVGARINAFWDNVTTNYHKAGITYEVGIDGTPTEYMRVKTNNGLAKIGINQQNPSSMVDINISSKNMAGQIIKGASSQTANLLEMKNSAGTILSTFNSNGNLGIGGSNTTYPLTVFGNTSGISAYFEGNISSAGYITRTKVYDKREGKALDYIKDSDEYKDIDGRINHSKFYGYTDLGIVTDLSRPVVEVYYEEVCSDIPFLENVSRIEEQCNYEFDGTYYQNVCTNVTITQERPKQNCVDTGDETCEYEPVFEEGQVIGFNSVCEPIIICEDVVRTTCEDIEKTRTTFPFQKREEGINMDDWVSKLEQAIYELKQENQLIKSQLCNSGLRNLAWC